VDLGPLGTYRLPASLREAYGVDTAQEFADALGVSRNPTSELGSTAEAAYQALRRGDSEPARALLINDLGISDEKADEALAKFPQS
jgi:hypothetical protein